MKNNTTIKFKFIITASCFNDEDIITLNRNFHSNYPEIASSLFRTHLKCENDKLEIQYEANIPEGNLADEQIKDIIRLNHHAECLYEDTNLEYFSIKVCVNDKWY